MSLVYTLTLHPETCSSSVKGAPAPEPLLDGRAQHNVQRQVQAQQPDDAVEPPKKLTRAPVWHVRLDVLKVCKK